MPTTATRAAAAAAAASSAPHELPTPTQYGRDIAVLEERIRGATELAALRSANLKELAEFRIAALKELIDVRAAMSEKAVLVASEQLTLRMDHANGLILQMKDREKDVARIETITAMEKRIDMLDGYREHTMGRTMGSNSMADLIFKIFPLLISSGVLAWQLVEKAKP